MADVNAAYRSRIWFRTAGVISARSGNGVGRSACPSGALGTDSPAAGARGSAVQPDIAVIIAHTSSPWWNAA